MGKQSKFFNDLESSEDCLGYLPYIEAFSYIIKRHDNLISAPFVFGIQGKWGTGKSTFMKLINKNLEKDFYTIEINPWEYGENQNFTTIFLAKLYNRVKNKSLLMGKDSGNKFIKAIFKPLKLSLGTTTSKLEYDFSKFSIDEQQKVIDSFVSENFALKESVNKLLDEKFFEKKKVIVFVDDLDRCSIEKIMQVIESIKLIFNSPNCIFFLGCDTSYIEGAILSKHKDFIRQYKTGSLIEANMKNFAREYLEKIIQIPFYIPPITKESIKGYVNSILLNRNISFNKKIKIDEDLYKTFIKGLGDEFLSEMIVIADLNPRRIKRILNLIFLNYTFLRFKNNEENTFKIDIKLLSLLVIIREVFPEYYKEKLYSENDCRILFKDFFNIYKNDKDLEDGGISNTELLNDNEGVIFELFKMYYESSNITNKKLNDQLKNIIQYISVSSMMSDGNYDTIKWGFIGEVKADTNGKKLKIFLDKIYSNEAAKEIVLWFFQSIYLENKEKYAFGLVQNIPVYKKNSYGKFDYKKSLLFRFEFDEKNNILYINLQGKGIIKSIITNIKGNICTSKYVLNENRIEIDTNTSDSEILKIKESIVKLVNSVENEKIIEIAATIN